MQKTEDQANGENNTKIVLNLFSSNNEKDCISPQSEEQSSAEDESQQSPEESNSKDAPIKAEVLISKQTNPEVEQKLFSQTVSQVVLKVPEDNSTSNQIHNSQKSFQKASILPE